jgi:ubiquinone/menaquinone biosynthesis C-methylase UbiE
VTGTAWLAMAAPNAQYNLAKPQSLSVRVAAHVRHAMFDTFMAEFHPTEEERVLDIGVTSDRTYSSSNYFEALYPHKHRVVAAGLQDASFLQAIYPGSRFVQADALRMPFADAAFDLVHSSAVLEHVGSRENQARMIRECVRVARRGICLTTPNRWFPIEFHTQLPLVHWLPKAWCRELFRRLGYGPLAEEENLNLLTAAELRSISAPIPGWRFRIAAARLVGWKSNLILFGHALS